MLNWSLPKQVLAVLAGSLGLAAYPLGAYASHDVIVAVAAGALLGTFNILLGYAAIKYTTGKPMTTLTNTVIGSMAIRLALLLGAMTVLILVLHVHTAALAASLFFYYIVYLALEIFYLQHKINTTTSHDARTRS